MNQNGKGNDAEVHKLCSQSSQNVN